MSERTIQSFLRAEVADCTNPECAKCERFSQAADRIDELEELLRSVLEEVDDEDRSVSLVTRGEIRTALHPKGEQK